MRFSTFHHLVDADDLAVEDGRADAGEASSRALLITNEFSTLIRSRVQNLAAQRSVLTRRAVKRSMAGFAAEPGSMGLGKSCIGPPQPQTKDVLGATF